MLPLLPRGEVYDLAVALAAFRDEMVLFRITELQQWHSPFFGTTLSSSVSTVLQGFTVALTAFRDEMIPFHVMGVLFLWLSSFLFISAIRAAFHYSEQF